ncbi:MAG: hypothetical protein R3E97_12325 [Candidatus Eisenbacteria bacterium]
MAGVPSPEDLAAFRSDPLGFFFDLRDQDAIACGQVLLTDPTLGEDEKLRMLTALAAIHTAAGRTDQARAACLAILEPDPRRDLTNPAYLPPPLKRLFYQQRDSLLIDRDLELPPQVRTIAVGDITAASLVPGPYDLNRFAKGLTHILVSDLQGATPMKIVDRQRLGVLMDEIGLSDNNHILDPAYAVPFGMLSGAQSFLFGNILQAEKDRIRLDLRWVDTSTSEILLSEGIEMKVKSADDLFSLERKVLADLVVPKMHQVLLAAEAARSEDEDAVGGEDEAPVPSEKELEKQVKRHIDEKKKQIGKESDYIELLLRTGDALIAEQNGDLEAARAAWADVESMKPGDEEAKSRSSALAAHLEISSEGR